MKMNKKLIALLFVSTLSSTTLANANTGSGSVKFIGSIISGACSIAPGSIDQTVELGSITKSSLLNGGNSTPITFNIELTDCDLSEAKSVSITFNGNSNPIDSGLLGITSSTGAGIQITDGNGSPIKIGEKTEDTHKLQAGDNTLLFSAYVKGIGQDINEGGFESIANFVLSYE